MTVKDILREREFCKSVIKCLAEFVGEDNIPSECSDTMADAVDIINRYIEELEAKQIK